MSERRLVEDRLAGHLEVEIADDDEVAIQLLAYLREEYDVEVEHVGQHCRQYRVVETEDSQPWHRLHGDLSDTAVEETESVLEARS